MAILSILTREVPDWQLEWAGRIQSWVAFAKVSKQNWHWWIEDEETKDWRVDFGPEKAEIVERRREEKYLKYDFKVVRWSWECFDVILLNHFYYNNLLCVLSCFNVNFLLSIYKLIHNIARDNAR